MMDVVFSYKSQVPMIVKLLYLHNAFNKLLTIAPISSLTLIVLFYCFK